MDLAIRAEDVAPMAIVGGGQQPVCLCTPVVGQYGSD